MRPNDVPPNNVPPNHVRCADPILHLADASQR
jgi:hypothetical protein